MAPDELLSFLGEYHALVVPLIQRNGGSIDKYLGDGILASFGAINSSASYAADLCRAVDAIAKAAEIWQAMRASRGLPASSVGIAAAVGEVVFGVVGDKSRLEYTVIGDVVNLASKLEKHTKAERVHGLATLTAYTLAVKQGLRPEREPERRLARRVEGISEPVDLVVLAA